MMLVVLAFAVPVGVSVEFQYFWKYMSLCVYMCMGKYRYV